MALPYLFESTFEQGTAAEWDSETDTGSLLDFPHYSTLAQLPWSNAAPYRGAYCARIQCGDTNDHTLTEGDIDIADGASASIRFYIYFAPNFTATADDVFSIFEFQQAGGTVEATIGIRITAASGLIEIGIGDGTAPSAYATQAIQRDRWYCVEATLAVATGGTGTFTLYLDGRSVVALTSQTHAAAVGAGVLGTQLTLATTTGTILLDMFAADDTRIYPFVDHYPDVLFVSKSQHIFVGEGEIANVTLFSTTDTGVDKLTIYDTDEALTGDIANTPTLLQAENGTAQIIDPAGMPVRFRRGAYLVLTPGNAADAHGPHARVNLCRHLNSPALVRRHGLMRSRNPRIF